MTKAGFWYITYTDIESNYITLGHRLNKMTNHFIEKLRFHPLSKWFFYALIFFLPFGTKIVFFTENSFYFGHHSFYNTFYLYLTDLLFLGLILAWLSEKLLFSLKSFSDFSFLLKRDRGIYITLLFFWLILGISVIFSREISLSFYGFSKITQYLLLFVYIKENAIISREIRIIFWLILAAFFLQSTLAVLQYAIQSSLGLKLFGEEFLRAGLRGVAEFYAPNHANSVLYNLFPYQRPLLGSNLAMRAYGTLPHPNVLAGLLTTGILFNICLLSIPLQQQGQKKRFSREIILVLLLIVLVTGLIVTFSRIAWAITGLVILFWAFAIFAIIRPPHVLDLKTGRLDSKTKNYFPGRIALVFLALLGALGLNLALFSGAIKDRILDQGKAGDYWKQESVTERETFNSAAIRMIKANPLTGIGWKNYVIELDNYTDQRLLPRQHQPVHNIYLLIAAESGMLALLSFLVLVIYIVRHALINLASIRDSNALPIIILLIALFGLLTVGLFDHYILTIQAGSLMFFTILGLLASKTYSSHDHV